MIEVLTLKDTSEWLIMLIRQAKPRNPGITRKNISVSVFPAYLWGGKEGESESPLFPYLPHAYWPGETYAEISIMPSLWGGGEGERGSNFYGGLGKLALKSILCPLHLENNPSLLPSLLQKSCKFPGYLLVKISLAIYENGYSRFQHICQRQNGFYQPREHHASLDPIGSVTLMDDTSLFFRIHDSDSKHSSGDSDSNHDS